MNGVASVSVSFSGTVGPVKFRARDSVTADFYGVGSEVTVGMGTSDSYVLNLIAYPTSATKVRLSWNKVPDAVGYNVYKKSGATFNLVSGSPFSGFIYEDAGPLTTGTAYEYKVEALKNVTLEVLNTATATATPAGCGATMSTDITTGVTTWLKAQSPICVTTPITVSNATLIIQPGVLLLFSSGAYLSIGTGGQLQAAGTATEMITMTAAADFSVLANRWGQTGNGEGIFFSSTAAVGTTFTVDGNYNYSSGSVIDYVLIEGSGRGIVNNQNLPLLIDHSIFRNIELKQNTGLGGIGISISNVNGAVVVRNSSFTHIRSGFASGISGGAVYMRYLGGGGYALLKNNIFVANSANAGGNSYAGAAHLEGDTNTTNFCEISGNYFYKNSVQNDSGGALRHQYATGTVRIKNNIFSANTAGTVAAVGGGGLYLDQQTSNTLVENNRFINNVAPGGAAGGGAISVRSSPGIVIKNNEFTGNSAVNGKGGAILLVAAGQNNIAIQKNTFSGNGAANGAGVMIDNISASGTIIEHNLFVNQTATTAGAAIHLGGTNVASTFIRFNSFGAGALLPTALYTADDATYTISGNWWGSVVTDGSACSANATLCAKSVGGFDVLLNSNQTAAPVLCNVNSADTSCVGSTY